MELGKIRILSYEELARHTDNFCDKNCVNHFQFGKFYRGKIEQAEWTQYVLVKIWEVPVMYNYEPGDNEQRLMDEVLLLRRGLIINHPGMPKLYGFCFEVDYLGTVYVFKPFDSIYNLIPKDGFSWLQRIKVALRLAFLLKFLHTANGSLKPFIVRNLDSAHILLDEDYNPKLCDFGLITGGIFPDKTIYRGHHVWGCYGYIDICASYKDDYSPKIDVFAFGAILVNLISKRVYDVNNRETWGPDITDWAYTDYEAYEESDDDNRKRPKFSIVHENLAADPDFVKADEHKISMLAIDCIRGSHDRPPMKQVVRRLLKLRVVKKHADFLGVNKLLCTSKRCL